MSKLGLKYAISAILIVLIAILVIVGWIYLMVFHSLWGVIIFFIGGLSAVAIGAYRQGAETEKTRERFGNG